MPTASVSPRQWYFFDPYEDVKLVGSAARDGGDPSRTIFRIKNWMDDPEYSIQIDEQEWTPTEISALILAKLKARVLTAHRPDQRRRRHRPRQFQRTRPKIDRRRRENLRFKRHTPAQRAHRRRALLRSQSGS